MGSVAIKVYGHPVSAPAKNVLMCLAEKDLDCEFVLVDLLTAEHKKEPYLSLNPFGQVPAFEHGDLQLFESRAIMSYIARTYSAKGTPLLSEDPMKNAIITVWTEVESQKFDAAGQKLNFELAIKPLLGMPTNEPLVEQCIPQLASVLDVYEARLAKSKYLAGDSFTLADLHHVAVVNNLMTTKAKAVFDERPHVSAWCADILARPTWKKVLARFNSSSA